MKTLTDHCRNIANRARQASIELIGASSAAKADCLRTAASQIRQDTEAILDANKRDLAAAPDYGLSDAAIDRLTLDHARIEGIASGVEAVAALPDPIGEVLEESSRPNGLLVKKIRIPLGVVFFIYESRPNVTADAAAIALASGNAIILRGGKEAAHSSARIVESMRSAIKQSGLPLDCVQLVDIPDREAVGSFLAMDDLIDIVIPRGGEALIQRVCAEAKMPVLKHFSGNCHLYVDKDADLNMARSITVNAKCQRMGVCNAAESLIVHKEISAAFLPECSNELAAQGIEIRADESARVLIPSATKASESDYATEYLGPKISVVVVDSLDSAIRHINQYGSRHTDAIISNNQNAIDRFTSCVDTAAVMVNTSTRFNDGGELGLGAEIGISTDKLHARGPCGIKELTTYKYVVTGTGQVRT